MPANFTGSLAISGSLLITGSIQTTGGITISGSIDSASYALSSSNASNAELLDNLDSTAFVFTSSYNVASSSLSTRVTKIEGNYATTGSNAFNGSQNITGSLTISQAVIAQTLNVQQVTSSIVYSCGSNTFGCSLANTQQFTGSMLVTGSNALFSVGCVGIGTSSPVTKLDVIGNARLFPASGDVNMSLRGFASQYINFTEASVADRGVIGFCIGSGDLVYRSGGYDMLTGTERFRITSGGNVGIGTTSPSALLDVCKCAANNVNIYNTNTYLNQGNLIRFQQNTTNGIVCGFLGHAGDSSGDFTIFNGGVQRVAISCQGIACFACQVCAPQGIFINGASSLQAQFGQNNDATGTQTSAIDIISRNAANTAGFTFRIQNCATTCTTHLVYSSNTVMALKCDGNVGIGTSSPTTILTIKNNSGGTNGIDFQNYSTTGILGQILYTQVDDVFSFTNTSAYSAGGIAIKTSSVERMRITSGGLLKVQNTGVTYETCTGGVNEIGTCANDTNLVFRNVRGSLTGARAGIDVFYAYAQPNSADASFYEAADSTDGSTRTLRFKVASNGAIYSRCTSIALISSDVRLKTDIIDYDKGLAEVISMKPRYYKYKDNLCEIHSGFIAQEINEALPGSMIESYKDQCGDPVMTYQVDWYPLLVNAIKQQQCQICTQASTITQLKTCLGIA